MTVTTGSPAGGGQAALPPVDAVSVTVDGVGVSVPKGTLVIRAAELAGIEIPRFCDHPLLDPVGACRQCMVDIEGQRKPMASCTITCTEGMVVHTQLTSAAAEKAQRGVMELLLVNHPLDCPVCDKGGECPLQNQAMSTGAVETRFEGVKRTFAKPVAVSPQVLLDRERCVLCARCTRFCQQIAGDPMIELLERGALQQVGTGAGEPLQSYFSGNTIQICPVGALTSSAYRFRSRPFDLVSSPGVCEHCAGGCAVRTDHRRGSVMRRLAADDPEVNEEWLCDKGRFGFRYAQAPDRLTTPLVRDRASGELRPASWPEALQTAAEGLAAARGRAAADAAAAATAGAGAAAAAGAGAAATVGAGAAATVGAGAAAGAGAGAGVGVGVLTGGRLTLEDAYAYAKFTRVVLGTHDIDFRARVHSAEEADFLTARVAGRGRDLDGAGVTHASLERAPVVVLAGLECEEEAPGVFLRLRKAYRRGGQRLFALAAFATRGLEKAGGVLLPAAPGTETEWLNALASGAGLEGEGLAASQGLHSPGAVIVVGERLAGVPGALDAVVRAASATGASVVWIPRRAGERGALEAGALPGLLPGGRPVTDPGARQETAALWGVPALPQDLGRDTGRIIGAAAGGELGALLVAGVEIADLPDPAQAREALSKAPFVVSLEQRPSEVTGHADVVFPVAAVAEKAGTFVNWEGRMRPFPAALKPDQMTRRSAPADLRVLHMLAGAMDTPLGLPDVQAAREEIHRLGIWNGPDASGANDVGPDTSYSPLASSGTAGRVPRPEAGEAVLAGHRLLLDAGRLQEGDDALAATRHAAVARLSAVTAAEAGVTDGAVVEVTGPGGAVRLPVRVTAMPDRVVWLPLNSAGDGVYDGLGTVPGRLVKISAPVAEPVPEVEG